MRAHRLNRRITVEEPTATRSETGDNIETWGTYCTAFASIEPLRGQEAWTELQQTATQAVRVVVRYSATNIAITPLMRISYDGSYYDIHSVIDIENRHREVQMLCTLRQLPDRYP